MRIRTLPFCLLILIFFNSENLFAQCGAGYTQASLNWDALDFIPSTGYSNASATAIAYNQSFTLGKNRVNISYSGSTSLGENNSQTGSTGSYGTGEDVQFSGNGIITMTFASAVENVKFSIYDIDKGQSIAFSANNSGTATPVILTKAAIASNLITISGSTVTSVTGNESNTANTTTVNVDIAGPVTSITLSISGTNSVNGGQADPDFWLSDISACVGGSFPNNYYQVSQPFTGMPGYILVAANKGVYQVDPATGRAKLIFTDGATSGTINSLAYDPYNKIAYYSWSLTNNGTSTASDRTLRKYDFNTETVSIVEQDVNTIGIPTFDQGIESGAAAFYDGALYLGIEGGADNSGGGPKVNTNKESLIWRIEFDINGVPTNITQAYATSGDTHDWSDFSINNGMLYDFNGDAGGEHYQHVNLQTGASLFVNDIGITPKQSGVGWDGKVYWVGTSIGEYDLNGSVGPRVNIVGSPAISNWSTSSSPSFGDAAEAFRPKADFGDAPASYDPDPLAPALHETVSNLRIGNTSDLEWNKIGSSATADDDTDDGMPYVQIISSGSTYVTDVNVFNNTGANATLAAWIDFNNDGIFDASEGIVQTITSSTTTQTINLFWSGITNNLPLNSYTYIRIRITSDVNGMTTSNSTGYFSDGEVEDYRVLVNSSILTGKFTNFFVQKQQGSVLLNWEKINEEVNTKYELQKSSDGKSWIKIYEATAITNGSNASYQFVDKIPNQPLTYYRLVMVDQKGMPVYSDFKKVIFGDEKNLKIFPNPATDFIQIELYSAKPQLATIRINTLTGKKVYDQKYKLDKGMNLLKIPIGHFVTNGIHHIEAIIDSESKSHPIFIQPNK